MNSSACFINPFTCLTPTTTTTTTTCPKATSFITNPIISPSTGNASACISGTAPLALNTAGLNILYFPSGRTSPHLIFGTYDIFVKLCLPNNALSSIKTVRLLTHGATLDHTYWNFLPPPLATATSTPPPPRRHATLSYDQSRGRHILPTQTLPKPSKHP
ncbi:hypothetical protein TgHK011_002684 [Trichoderma gracile]|nr:hypothetical protein TgHK011_002684 [Trichoderma gracile]